MTDTMSSHNGAIMTA